MRIGIIGDIHEDAAKLSLALRGLEKKNCDTLVCLGDIAGFDNRNYSHGYSRDLQYCIALVKANCPYSIIGNHDLFAIKKNPSSSAVFDFPPDWYQRSLAERKQLGADRLWYYEFDAPVSMTDGEEEYLRSLPEYHVVADGDLRILFTHSVYPDVSGLLSVKPVRLNDFQTHFDAMLDMQCSVGISGHLHPCGIMKVQEKKIVSPKFGVRSIDALPAHCICPCIADGTQDNGFTVLDTKTKTIEAIPLRTPQHSTWW